MDPLVEGQEMGAQQQLSLRGSPIQPEVVTTIKTKGRTFASSYEEEAAAMELALSWTSTNANHPVITILFCRDSKFHQILVPLQFTIPLTPSSFNGSLAILLFQVTN